MQCFVDDALPSSIFAINKAQQTAERDGCCLVRCCLPPLDKPPTQLIAVDGDRQCNGKNSHVILSLGMARQDRHEKQCDQVESIYRKPHSSSQLNGIFQVVDGFYASQKRSVRANLTMICMIHSKCLFSHESTHVLIPQTLHTRTPGGTIVRHT